MQVQQKEAKSLSLQSLMQGDSGSQHPKNVWGWEEREGCATETCFSDGMKRGGIWLNAPKTKKKLKKNNCLNDNCYTFVDKDAYRESVKTTAWLFLNHRQTVDILPLLLVPWSMKCCWSHLWVALHRLILFLCHISLSSSPLNRRTLHRNRVFSNRMRKITKLF